MRRLYISLLAIGEAVCLLSGMMFIAGATAFFSVRLLKTMGHYRAMYPYLPYIAGTVLSLAFLTCTVLLIISLFRGSTISDLLDETIFKKKEKPEATLEVQ